MISSYNSLLLTNSRKLVAENDKRRLKELKAKWGHVNEVRLGSLVRQVAVGIHESSKLAKDVQVEQTSFPK